MFSVLDLDLFTIFIFAIAEIKVQISFSRLGSALRIANTECFNQERNIWSTAVVQMTGMTITSNFTHHKCQPLSHKRCLTFPLMKMETQEAIVCIKHYSTLSNRLCLLLFSPLYTQIFQHQSAVTYCKCFNFTRKGQFSSSFKVYLNFYFLSKKRYFHQYLWIMAKKSKQTCRCWSNLDIYLLLFQEIWNSFKSCTFQVKL